MKPYEFAKHLRDSGYAGELTQGECQVLLMYMAYADGLTGFAFPSTEKIAADLGHTSDRFVRRARAKLVKRGLLVASIESDMNGRREHYGFTLSPGRVRLTRGQIDPGRSINDPSAGGSVRARTRVNSSTKGGVNSARRGRVSSARRTTQ